MGSYKRVAFEIRDKTAYVGFGADGGSVTVLDEPTLHELEAVVREIGSEQKNLKGAVFHSLKEGCFLAGVDINLIDSLETEGDIVEGVKRGQDIYDAIESLAIPTVSCVQGHCLGGGMELVLSTKSIIMADDEASRMGLPEVKLGLIPAFGGTYRLPRRTSLPFALDLILTGRFIGAAKAKRAGIVDETYPRENLLKMAPLHFHKRIRRSFALSLGNLVRENVLSRKIIFQKAREGVLKKTKGFYRAPLKILDTMESGMIKPKSAYLSGEAQAFAELCMGKQSKSLRSLFFLSEEAKKYPGPASPGDVPRIRRGACLGAGTMGGGIAWLMAEAGMAPIIKDVAWGGCELGLRQSADNFSGRVKRKKLARDEAYRRHGSIRPQLDYEGFGRMDMVVEAVVEDRGVKEKVFSELEGCMRDDALIVSNTSSLSIEQMASSLRLPGRFGGLHFFNPVSRMPLVEIVTHSRIEPANVEALYRWVLSVGKTPLIVSDAPGFLINRILMPYLNEAGHLLDEGVALEDIDQACLDFGMPMGPFRLLDEIGIDVALKVSGIVHEGLGDRIRPSAVIGKMAASGLLGKKASKGFYIYGDKGGKEMPNREVASLLGRANKDMEGRDIQLRIFIPMINEAAYVLQEGIVGDASKVDLGLIFGIGFPPFRGGLLRHADEEGTAKILECLRRFAETVSDVRYRPSPYIEELGAAGGTFYSRC